MIRYLDVHDVGHEVEQEAPIERHTLHHRLPRGTRAAAQNKAEVRQGISQVVEAGKGEEAR